MQPSRWKCFMVEMIAGGVRLTDGHKFFCKFRHGDRELWPDELPVGATWNNPERGLCVQLPGRVIWAMDELGTDGTSVWKREGEPPDLIVMPSINAVGLYHGFVGSNAVPPGYVSEDVEGRKFDDMGKPIK